MAAPIAEGYPDPRRWRAPSSCRPGRRPALGIVESNQDGKVSTESEPLLVITTSSGAADADRIASALVERRLAACVNALRGAVSTYRWEGRIARDEETVLLIKTTAERYSAVEAAIRELSGYELPEVIAVRVERGLPGYLDWIADSVKQDAE